MRPPAEPRDELPLESKIALLADPRTYPAPPPRIDTIETHMSWVFLTETLVYKLKKPVRYDFLDYSTLGARERSCREEVRLNRPLAPGVYLGVAPLALTEAGDVRLEAAGRPVEWLVKMRRLPAERMLDRVIGAGTLHASEIERVAEVLIDFYRSAQPVAIDGPAYRAQFERMIALNRRALSAPAWRLPAALVEGVHDALRATLARRPELFERRARAGRIVEGHGDLRPEHVCLEPARPIVFDRLEFNRRFREVDPVEELAFLAMECERLGEARVRPILFERYRAATGDEVPAVLVNFYMAHRACIRARLAAAHTADLEPPAWGKWLDRAAGYLRLAEGYCRPDGD